MCREIPFKKLISFVIFSFVFFNNYSQNILVTALNNASIPAYNLDSSLNLSFLDTTLQNNQILALGEASHSTKEFFLAKNEIIKYCVTHLNYKTIELEADYCGAIAVDDYIIEGKGNAKDVIKKMRIPAWMTYEMIDLVEWLKVFNSNKSTFEKVRFCGFDMQFTKNLIYEIKSKLLIQNDLTPSSMVYLDSLKDRHDSKRINSEKSKLLLAELYSISLDKFTQEERDFYKQLLVLLSQYLDFKSKIVYHKIIATRDKYMAENIRSLVLKHNGKMIIWAHNVHISRGVYYKKVESMGSYLHKEFKNKYYNLALFTGSGNISIYNRINKKIDYLEIPKDKKKKSIDAIFSKCKFESFFIDFNRLSSSNDLIYKKFNNNFFERTISIIKQKNKNAYYALNYYHKSNISQDYNGFLFIRNTNGSTGYNF